MASLSTDKIIHDVWVPLTGTLTALLANSEAFWPDNLLEMEDDASERTCNLVDLFQCLVDLLDVAPWDEYLEHCQDLDLATLYACLQAVEQADKESRVLCPYVEVLQGIQEDHLRGHGSYPRDISLDLLTQVSRCSASLRIGMDTFRTAVRHKIASLTRTLQRPLTILDLPHEILLKVFEHVRGELPMDPEHAVGSSWGRYRNKGSSDIRNVRLTCRAFNEIGSRFLLDTVTVHLAPESLSHLQTISEHPLLRKSPCAVVVSLSLYDSELAQSVRAFATYCARRLREETMDTVQYGISYYPEASVAVRGAVWTAWHHFGAGEDIPTGSENYVQDLQTAHRELKELHEEQENLLQAHEYAQAFADAIVKMPYVQILQFTDAIPFRRSWRARKTGKDFDTRYVPLDMARCYVRPCEVTLRQTFGLRFNTTLDPAIRVLAAISQARISVTGLSIDVYGGRNDCAGLITDAEVRDSLLMLAKQLRNVIFSLRYCVRAGPIVETEKNIHQFLALILRTTKLERLFVNFDRVGHRLDSTQSIGPILNRLERPGLRSLHLTGVALRESELRLLFDAFKPMSEDDRRRRALDFRLEEARLISGSWAGVLDLLRGKVGWNATVDSPSGAECDDMSHDEYDRIFGHPVGGEGLIKGTKAEHYIREWYLPLPNPFNATDATAEE